MKYTPFALLLVLFVTIYSCQNEPPSHVEPLLLSDSLNKAAAVFMAVDEKELPVASWIEVDKEHQKHFYFATWDSISFKFGQPQEIPIPQNVSTTEEEMPKIAFRGDGTMFATYESSVPVPGVEWGSTRLTFVTSSDRGKTWSEPQLLAESDAQVPSQSFSGLSKLGNGELAAAWLDANPNPKERSRVVMFAKTEGGNTFGTPIMISEKACECCRIAVAGNKAGRIAVAFRDLTSANVRDMSIAISDDHGKTFTKPVDFSGDNWVMKGCPHNGPAIAMDAEHIYATWYSGVKGGGVYFAQMDFHGKVLTRKKLSSKGSFIQLTNFSGENSALAFNEDYEENDTAYSRIKIAVINSKRMIDAEISEKKVHANHPVLQALDESSVIVAWRDGDKIYYEKVDVPTHI